MKFAVCWMPVQCSGSPAASLLVGIEVEPALAAGRLRPRVPGDAEGLQAAARHLHQILLQRRDAQGEGDLELAGLAVGPVGAHEEPCRRGERRS